MRFLDLFAGIGGFRLGMSMAGHECVGYVEWDNFARKSYEAIHDTKGEWTAHDITRVTDDDVRRIGSVDIICGGFPCQAFSVAGKREGFRDTRGTLFFEIMRFASILRPQYLFLENVKGLLNHEGGDTFETILRTMDELGYDAEWQVLNSKDYEVPQNRERVFIIGHLRGTSTRKVFPIGEINEKNINLQRQQIYTNTITARYNGVGQESYVVERKQYAQAVIDPKREKKTQNGRLIKDQGDPMFSLTVTDRHGIYDGQSIRLLTPRECFRLQGFPDWAFDKASQVNSDSQLYKQAGNSVTVNVIYEIAKRL
jgi:DNA (cytosine-5)-methyltransferase 1